MPLILPGTWLLVIGALNLFYGISVISGSHIFITTAAWLTDDAQPWGSAAIAIALLVLDLVVLGSFIAGIEESRTRAVAT